MAKLQFNRNDVPPQEDKNEEIPIGKYPAVIDKAEIKPTKAGNGHLLNVTFRISGDKQANRCAFARFNFDNPSEVAQRIGQQQLAQLCEAVGIVQMGDTDELLGKSLEIDIRFTKGSGDYPDKHEPKYFKALAGAGATVADFGDSGDIPF